MLLLAAYNPFGNPLTVISYACIDFLSDPYFPLPGWKKPSPWPQLHDLVESTRRQLKSLTKGLLEVTLSPMAPGIFRVDFFHRTVSDFVLENMTLESTLAKYRQFTNTETYHRMLLAEFSLWDLPVRTDYLLSILHGNLLNPRAFQQELPLETLECFNNVLRGDMKTLSEGHTNLVAKGCSWKIWGYEPAGRFSFVHLVAFIGQRNYVLQEVEKDPALLSSNDGLNILLSAASCHRKDLIKDLIERGSSPFAHVGYESRMGGGHCMEAPVWVLVMAYIVNFHLGLNSQVQESAGWQVLELFLEHAGIMARGCVLFLGRHHGSYQVVPKNFIRLTQFIRGLRATNGERLLELLGCAGGGSPLDSAGRSLDPSNTSSNATRAEEYIQRLALTLLDSETDKGGFRLTRLICGDIRLLELDGFRIF